MKMTMATISAVLFSVLPAFAAEGTRQDHSGLVVWVFLGFCALIVVAQLVPAVLMMVGFAKGIGKDREFAPQEAKK